MAVLQSALLQVTVYLKLISRSKCPQQFFPIINITLIYGKLVAVT